MDKFTFFNAGHNANIVITAQYNEVLCTNILNDNGLSRGTCLPDSYITNYALTDHGVSFMHNDGYFSSITYVGGWCVTHTHYKTAAELNWVPAPGDEDPRLIIWVDKDGVSTRVVHNCISP